MSKTQVPLPQHVLDNPSNQLNTQYPEYHRNRGADLGRSQLIAGRDTSR